MNQRERTAVVTGASRGIGLAVARRLLVDGCNVVATDISPEGVEAFAAEVGADRALALRVDVTSKDDVTRMIAAAAERFGSVDVLVNNAGLLYGTPVLQIGEDEWDRVMAVNVKGTFLCSQAAVPHMQRRRWGRIVNLSSTAGKNVSTVGGAHYTAAKAAILGLTRHLAKEVAGDGITVNSVCPGLFDTEMVRQVVSQGKIDAYVASFPIHRLGTPEEVADLIGFLASDQAAYITGASVDINGGDLMI